MYREGKKCVVYVRVSTEMQVDGYSLDGQRNILKKYAEPLLASVKPNEKEYAEAQRMLSFLRFFKEANDDSCIANNSILREFIGGSVLID